MSWKVEFAPEQGSVVITACGEIHNEDVTAQATEALRLLTRHHTVAVLADYSDALSEVSLPSLYGLPDAYTRAGAPWNARLALVLPRTKYRLNSYHFFELVCKNAGYHIQLFEARDAAAAWLAQTSSPRESFLHPAHH